MLVRCLGCTASSSRSFAWSPVTGELAYPVGNFVVFYNVLLNKQTRFLTNPSGNHLGNLDFSRDGKYLLASELGETSMLLLFDLSQQNQIYGSYALNYLKHARFGLNDSCIIAIAARSHDKDCFKNDDNEGDSIFLFDWISRKNLDNNLLQLHSRFGHFFFHLYY